ncbi:MAG: hypothetical protein IPK82_26010 [Polyangiaceae bacterium]|nr:hypothetical protein [Polyangiaceae bacterium]
MKRQMQTFLAVGTVGFLTAVCSPGCEDYVGAPRPAIIGLEQGTLSDLKAPLAIGFDRAIDPATLQLKVVRLIVDEEGFLGDEDADGETELDILYSYDALAKFPNEGGKGTFNAANMAISIVPEKPFPVAEKLAILVEAGLSDAEGVHKTILRERIPFTYLVKLNCAPSADFVTGAYYFLGEVTKPIGTQVQLLAWLDVNPDTGEFVGAFVNGDRNRDASRCTPFGLSCTDDQACRTIPEPACVPPSEKAASVDEYPDYLPNYEPPTGYFFNATGCVDGQSGDKIFFVNQPVDVVVQSPAVSLVNTVLTATFEKDSEGVLRGGGTITAEKVFLGKIDSGTAEGQISARLIPAEEVPPGLKKPGE